MSVVRIYLILALFVFSVSAQELAPPTAPAPAPITPKVAIEIPKKILYINAAVEIEKGLAWEELGVTSKESFTEVITKSWKIWAESHFNKFELVETIAPPGVTSKSHHFSAILQWSSQIKKLDDKYLELSAEYVLRGLKSNEVLLSYSFPAQKILIDHYSNQVTGSKVASLIYNLLNSQTGKIKTIHDSIKESDESVNLLIVIRGNVSLSETIEIKNILQNRFKEISLSVELKEYSLKDTSLFIRASVTEEKLLLTLANAGQIPINEQKILLFKLEDKSFAIIPKEQIIK